VKPAGQQRGPLGDQQRLRRRHPHSLRPAVEPVPGAAAEVPRPDRQVVRDQRRLGRSRVAQDRAPREVPGLGGNAVIKVAARKARWNWVVRFVSQGHRVRAAGSEPAGESRVLRCSPDAEPETVLSYLTQKGKAIETSWTSAEHDKRPCLSWILPCTSATGPQEAAEFARIRLIESPDGWGRDSQMSDPLQHDALVFVTATHRSLRHAFRKVSPRHLERKTGLGSSRDRYLHHRC
jgi:hypothetical protein